MFGTHLRRLSAAATLLLATTLTGCATITEDISGETNTPDTTSNASTNSATPTPRPTPTAAATQPSTTNAADGTALAALATLPVKGRAPMTGYDRDQFGQEWSDAAGTFPTSRNGCDTRNDILARDLQRETVESNGCVVVAGILAYEPYTGQTDRTFLKGGSYEQSFDLEHLVALGNAWVTGAQQLSPDERAALANDPDNLFLSDPSLNRSKGDADAATWLPPNKSFRCSYVARQIRIKVRYDLWVTAPEKAAMERVLSTCPTEPLDQPEVQDGYRASGDVTVPEPGHSPSQAPQQPTNNGGGSVYYENCDAARAAGAAPVYAGDPGYGSHLDRDGDGSACE